MIPAATSASTAASSSGSVSWPPQRARNASQVPAKHFFFSHISCPNFSKNLSRHRDQFCFKLLYGCKLLQIKQLRFEEPKEIFHDSIIQAIPLSAHALPNVLAFQHVPILSMLVMPALVRVKNQICPIRNFMKRFLQHGGHHL